MINDIVVSGSDYIVINLMLNFVVGESSKFILILIIDDLIVEVNESFRVNLFNFVVLMLDMASVIIII